MDKTLIKNTTNELNHWQTKATALIYSILLNCLLKYKVKTWYSGVVQMSLFMFFILTGAAVTAVCPEENKTKLNGASVVSR